MRRLVGLAAVIAATSSAAAAQSVRFIACPIYRDTDAGRKSGCWLADELTSGARYDVSRSPTLPDWNFEILVEGDVAAEQDDACGGVVLAPVRVSLMPGSCPRHMLPPEEYKGRKFVLPPRNVRPLSEARKPPAGPIGTRTFHILYDFNRSFLVYQLSDFLLDEAITYIRAAKPERVEITGYAATAPTIVSGRSISERPELARQRAEMIRESLIRLGVPAGKLRVRWKTDAQAVAAEGADGLAETSKRRVEIKVIPGAAGA